MIYLCLLDLLQPSFVHAFTLNVGVLLLTPNFMTWRSRHNSMCSFFYDWVINYYKLSGLNNTYLLSQSL